MSINYNLDIFLQWALKFRLITSTYITKLANIANIINVIILLLFNKLIVKLALRLVPESKDNKEEDLKVVKFIDDRIIETPSIALGSIVKETLRMGKSVKKA